MKILVIIVSYKDDKNLKECLESLDSCRGRNDTDSFDVRVHDNSSDNLGFARGVNVGLKKYLTGDKIPAFAGMTGKKKYDWVWLLNPDCTVEFKGIYRNVYRKIRGVSVDDTEYDVFSPVIYDEHGKIWFAGGKINKWSGECSHSPKYRNLNIEYRNKWETEWVSGCSMFVRREVFEKIGFFDEKFFLFYEDVDFCLRAREAGFRVEMMGKEGIEGLDELDGLRVIHKVSQSVNRLPNKYEIEMKSKFYLLRKHWKYFYPTAIIISWLRMLKHKLDSRSHYYKNN